jgi:hypothetical protein
VADLPRCWFFGCWDDAGHFLWLPNGARAWECPVGEWAVLDCVFAPGVTDPANTPDRQNLGVWRRTVVKGCTVIACWDRSLDERLNSNGAFIVEGERSLVEVLEIAKAQFPSVTARILKHFSDEHHEVVCPTTLT